MQDVIVIGMNYSISLGVIRSLGEAGYGVRLLGFNKNTIRIAGKSKYITKSILTKFETEKIFEALEVLRGKDDTMLVIPLNDRCCRLIDEHYDLFAQHYYVPNINEQPKALSDLMDKMKQKELAQAYGLLTAKGSIYDTNDNGINKANKEVAFPCFLKPFSSAEIQNSKTAFAVCHDEQELFWAMKMNEKRGCEHVLIEEYLDITQELCLYGVAGNGKVSAPVLIETTRGGFSEHKGVAAEGTAVSADRIRDIKEKVEKLVETIHLTGLFCVDLFRCDDKVLFSEINLRGGGSGYAVTLSGVNLPAILANTVYRRDVFNSEGAKREVKFLNERIEFDAYTQGFISFKDYRAHLKGNTERFIRSTEDPEPWRQFKKMTLRVTLKSKIRAVTPQPIMNTYRKMKNRQTSIQ